MDDRKVDAIINNIGDALGRLSAEEGHCLLARLILTSIPTMCGSFGRDAAVVIVDQAFINFENRSRNRNSIH